jgi:hypothetical protein
MTALLGIGAPLVLIVALFVVWGYRHPHTEPAPPLPKRTPGRAKADVDLNDPLSDDYVDRVFAAIVANLPR